ncbi:MULTISPECIES: DUF2877 domain-containing protein [Clostridia]|uniref:DUF2877 domain-containing protein n=1 Tax=Clostridia TaxID=186801 RepID=UPI000EA0F62B|nr:MULTISPECIES: DUF2877 domain-containing protein [Clostridia]NBJ71063.1 DUF2877 domain-containing protein [Roseburia sp. 1XD42-34]RKI75345.1 DUF2877 domain-containing protein [Clostridium sp. 1xD42-85]
MKNKLCLIHVLDKHLLDWFNRFKTGEQIGIVHSIFDKVINFISHDDSMLFSLAKDRIVQSPKMMKTTDEFGFNAMCSSIKPSNPVVKVGEKAIQIKDWQWSYMFSERWERELSPLSQVKPALSESHLAYIDAFIEANGRDGGLLSAWKYVIGRDEGVSESSIDTIYFQPFVKGFKTITEEIRKRQLKEFMYRFAGLGVGLTPSGDDFLTGLLATWHYFGFSLYQDFMSQGNVEFASLKRRTTDVSYFMLENCCFGYVNDALLDLLECIPHHPTNSLQQVLSIGSTSGTDMLIGVSFAYRQLLKQRNLLAD